MSTNMGFSSSEIQPVIEPHHILDSDVTPTLNRDIGIPSPVRIQQTLETSLTQTPDSDANKHYSKTTSNHHHHDLLNLITQELNFVEKIYPELGKHQQHINQQVKDAKNLFNSLKAKPELKALKELKKIVTKLKLQIPVKYLAYEESSQQKNHKGVISSLLKEMPKFHSEAYDGSLFCQVIQQRYYSLKPLVMRLCLLCFSMFPENAIISRRLMVYWWIAEGFFLLEDNSNSEICEEEYANNVFKQLVDLEFIEPVSKRQGSNVANCKMHPMVRAALVIIAERVKFFDFDKYGNPKDFGKFDEFESPEDVLDMYPLDDPVDYFNFQDKNNTLEFTDLKENSVQFKEKTSAPVDDDGKGVDNNDKGYIFEKKKIVSKSYKVCLMGSGLSKGITWEKLHMLFNVKDDILEFKPEWFLRLKNVNIIILGRWQSLTARHIEAEEFKLEESLKHMKHLRLFSLQGVSGISELPKSISYLKSLLILDLRSCYNLYLIPKTIGSLKCLTHLDMSECHLLEHMPKEISSLSSLEVLKGFVVIENPGKNTCTLEDLQKVENLRKLSMYTHMKEFPQESHCDALQKLDALRKLTIRWGIPKLKSNSDNQEAEEDNQEAEVNHDKVQRKSKNNLVAKLFSRKERVKGCMRRMNAFNDSMLGSRLQKLDLKCFPDSVTPSWLMPGKLQELNKLYIRGGKFCDIGQYQHIVEWGAIDSIPQMNKWNVKVLRLKYLEDLKMNWSELENLFPHLTSLEKVKCPRLTLFPCNERGDWTKNTTT